MKHKIVLALAAALFAAPASAATTVGFNLNFFGSPSLFSIQYSEQGFRFRGATSSFELLGPTNPLNPDKDGGSLGQPFGAVRVFAIDGSTFTLNSLLATNYFASTTTQDISFTFTTAAGVTSETRSLDALAGFQTLGFNRANLTQFTFTGPILIDEVVLNAPIPEPQTWALMILGFGGVGLALRRRASLGRAALLR